MSARQRDLAVRIALGASAAQLRELVLGEVMALVAFASVAGLGLAMAAARLSQSLLFEVSRTSPAVPASAVVVAVVPARFSGLAS